jgi:peptidoglycan/LPS O-acetylase OafA/YrhL
MPRAGAVRLPTRRPRLAVLDGLRLLAALAVAVFHYSVAWRVDGVNPPEYFLPTASHVAVYGFLGVELFFVISGFVICMSSWGRPLGDFFASRVTRLYPAYWACILITVAVLALVPISGGLPPQEKLTLTDIAVNLTMLQQPMGVPHVDTVYWTLFAELRFYLLFAILVQFGLTYRRVVLFCAVWLTVAILAPTLQSPLVTILTVPEYAPYFVAGVAMYLIHRFGPSPLLYAIVGFAWLVSLQRVEERVAAINPGFAVPYWPGALLITAAYAVVLVVALGWTDRITWRWLTVAGAVTYPFYLLHQQVGYRAIRTAYLHTGLPVWVLIGVTVAGLAGLA